MAVVLGLNAKLYRNTGTFAVPVWNLIPNVKDLTLNLEKGEADVTRRASASWRERIATLKEASIEFQMVWDTADEDFTAIKDAFFNNTAIEFAVMDGLITGPATQGLRATMDVFNFSREENLEEALTVSVTIKPTFAANPPSWMVVP